MDILYMKRPSGELYIRATACRKWREMNDLRVYNPAVQAHSLSQTFFSFFPNELQTFNLITN